MGVAGRCVFSLCCWFELTFNTNRDHQWIIHQHVKLAVQQFTVTRKSSRPLRQQNQSYRKKAQ